MGTEMCPSARMFCLSRYTAVSVIQVRFYQHPPSIVAILSIFPQVYGLVEINKMLTPKTNLSILRTFSRCSS
jgi:hypothetical protein